MLKDERHIIQAWMIEYNTDPPHTGLSGLTPNEFVNRSRMDQNLNRLSS